MGQTISASSQKHLAPGPFIDRGNPYHAGNLTTGNATLTTKSGAQIHTTGKFHVKQNFSFMRRTGIHVHIGCILVKEIIWEGSETTIWNVQGIQHVLEL